MIEARGVIIGCDETQECLLRPWWHNYSKHNSYPVTFFDFGMSNKALDFCKAKGQVIKIELLPLNLSPFETFLWQDVYGKNISTIWIKKAKAICQCTYDNTIWLDLDCITTKSLDELFDSLGSNESIGLSYDKNGTLNTGVIIFKKNDILLKEFDSIMNHDEFKIPDDQIALNIAIQRTNACHRIIDKKFNTWVDESTDLQDSSVSIYHFLDLFGKKKLVDLITLSESYDFEDWLKIENNQEIKNKNLYEKI